MFDFTIILHAAVLRGVSIEIEEPRTTNLFTSKQLGCQSTKHVRLVKELVEADGVPRGHVFIISLSCLSKGWVNPLLTSALCCARNTQPFGEDFARSSLAPKSKRILFWWALLVFLSFRSEACIHSPPIIDNINIFCEFLPPNPGRELLDADRAEENGLWLLLMKRNLWCCPDPSHPSLVRSHFNTPLAGN